MSFEEFTEETYTAFQESFVDENGSMNLHKWRNSFEEDHEALNIHVSSLEEGEECNYLASWTCKTCTAKYRMVVSDKTKSEQEKVDTCPVCNFEGWEKFNTCEFMPTPETQTQGVWPQGATPFTDVERGIVDGVEEGLN